MRLAYLLALATTACSGLESLHGVCGDGVVDIGEDCDSGKDCRACSIDCSEAACPDGYACGVDKLCHAPGGSFRSSRPEGMQSLPALGFGITDTDGDGYDDIVGLSKSSMITLHGDGGGSLDRQDTTIIPTIQGPPSVTHIDNDKTLDLIIPTFDGLVAFTSPFGVISPFPFPIALDLSNQNLPKPITTLTLDGHFLALVVAQAGGLGIVTIDATVKDPMSASIGFKSVCPGIDPATVSPDLIDRYDVAGATPTHVLAIESTDGKLCMVEMDHFVITNATLAATATSGVDMPPPPPLLARLAASACPSLIITDTTDKLVEYPGAGIAGACTLSGATRQLPRVQGQGPVGHVPLVPALVGYGADVLAYPTGLYAIDYSPTPGATSLYHSIRGFAHVVSTDLDGDGDLDVIGSSGVFGSQGASDDLELLYRYGTSSAGFLSVNLDTLSAPTHLVTGDFDGDGVGDIVYVEALAGFQRLMVAFGGHDGIHAPVVVSSSFHGVITAAPLALSSSSDPTGTKVDDLFVLDTPANAGPAEVMLLTVLSGSPQRTLIPFFDPRPLAQSGEMTFGFSGAVSGHFTSAPSDTAAYQELLGIERFYSATATSRLWLMQATKFGAMQPTNKVGVETQAITDCDPAAPTHPMLCGNVAQYVPWRPNNDTPDVVFGIDQSDDNNLLVLDPQALAAPAHASLASLVGPGLAPHSSYLADIDGDGEMERLINFGPRLPSATPSGAVVRCRYDGAVQCEKVDIPDLAEWTCLDAVPARILDHQRFDPLPPKGAAQELAMLCRDASRAAVFRVFHDDTGFHARLVLPLDTTAVSELQIGDMTGDGVDDVVLFGVPAAGAVPVIRVHAQCTSRQIADCPPLEFPQR